MKSPRWAGVAGGVGEGEVVPAGGVLEGDAAFLSEDAGLKPRRRKLKSNIGASQLWNYLLTNVEMQALQNLINCVSIHFVQVHL